MKFFVVFTAATVALVSGAEIPNAGVNSDVFGQVIRNELIKSNRRVFSRGAGGGWGSSSGGDSGYRPGPPPPPHGGSGGGGLLNLLSNFGLSSGSSGGPFRGGLRSPPPPPPPQYGPPPSSGNGGGRPPSSQYGPPGTGGNGGAGNGGYSTAGVVGGLSGAIPTRGRIPSPGGNPGLRNNVGGPSAAAAAGPAGGKIYRYVSLFTAPDEPAPQRPKIVRAGPTNPDKHVNIIFVRPPAPPVEQPTEVVLAPEPERKTIVYVLMKKPVEGQETVRVRPALPTQPPKPEVFFIPYTDPSAQQQQGGPGGDNNGQDGSQGGYGNGPSDGGNGGSGGYSDSGSSQQQQEAGNGGYSSQGTTAAGPSGLFGNAGPSNSLLFSGAVGLGGYA